jgi:hypothetical protein
MSRYINVTCGIYNTYYELVSHRDGSVTVRVPGISWRDNTGTLKHSKVWINDPKKSPELSVFLTRTDWLMITAVH